mgnify:FL=1
MAKLGDICTFQSGGTPSKSNSEYFNGSIPWITTVALTGDYIGKNDAVDWITDKAIQESAAKIIPENSIMVGTRVGIGKVAINAVPMSTSQDIVSLINIDDTKWDKKFLCKVILARNNVLLSQARGATIKGIKIDTLAKLEIPEIPLNEQRRISAVLDKVSGLIAKRREQLDKLDELVKARFVEMFGDPSANSQWPTQKLSKLGELNRGVSKHRPRNDPDLLGGPYPLIQTGDVSNSGLYISDYSSTYSELGLAQSRLWKEGTLCITIAANIAQTSILAFDACFPDSVVGFLPGEKTNAVFVHYWFSFFQKILEEQAPQVAQKNINLKILSDLDVIVPPYNLQADFSDFVGQIEKSKLTIQQSLDRLEVLKKALMQQYFG